MRERKLILDTLQELNETLEKEGVRLEGIFGSHARGEADDFSDIDILYSTDPLRFFPENGFKKAIFLQDLKSRMEALFHRPVDLIPRKGTSGILDENIRREFQSV